MHDEKQTRVNKVYIPEMQEEDEMKIIKTRNKYAIPLSLLCAQQTNPAPQINV